MQQAIVWIVIVFVLIVVGLGMYYALRSPRTTPMTFPADDGQNFIDVTEYPEEMQTLYAVFTRRCSRCHTIARPINSDFKPEEWRKYVLKMMRKPGSGLNPKTAEQIIKFLTYDAQHRKKSAH